MFLLHESIFKQELGDYFSLRLGFVYSWDTPGTRRSLSGPVQCPGEWVGGGKEVPVWPSPVSWGVGWGWGGAGFAWSFTVACSLRLNEVPLGHSILWLN